MIYSDYISIFWPEIVSETLLGDHECPQELSHCLFAYKRIDAKIAWPKTSS